MYFFTLSPIQKRNLRKILLFNLVWFVFALVFGLLQKSILLESKFYPNTKIDYNFEESLMIILPLGIIIGLIFGIIEILFFKRILAKTSFGKKIFLKIIIYTLLILFLVATSTFLGYSLSLNKSIFSSQVLKHSANYISNISFWFVIFYSALAFGVSLFLTEVSDNLGQDVLKNYIIGKYHKPREEERIFMFLDMKSSTTIAEELGHVKYFQLLNEYYADMTKIILQTYGKIYQYVGDEIVVYWDTKNGVKNNNCIECFFLIKNLFDTLSDKYMESYNIVPNFKAGYHYGKVTTGEIGSIKKEIVFSGDVLNTTARIQGECNNYNVQILVSSELISIVNLTNYKVSEIGEIKLRGKNSNTLLYSVDTLT